MTLPALRERHLEAIAFKTGVQLPLPPNPMPPLAELVELGMLRQLAVIQSVAQIAEVAYYGSSPCSILGITSIYGNN